MTVLPEACRRGHDSVFVYEHLISGDLLLRAKDSFKCHNNPDYPICARLNSGR